MGCCSSKKETDKNGRSIYEKEALGADHDGAINCMALSEDRSILITGSEDHTARIWSTQTDDTECLGVLGGHTGYITCVASSDVFVLTGSGDGTIRKWDMASCECLFTYEGHESIINRLICDGEFIFSSSFDKTVRAWLFDTSEIESASKASKASESASKAACVRVFRGHTGGVYPMLFLRAPEDGLDPEDEEADAVAIRPGDLLITGSTDKTAKSWSVDSETGQCLKTFRGHTAPVSCMVTDRDCTTLFTAGPDRVIKLWEISTAVLIRTMGGDDKGHTQSIVCMQLLNKLLYTGSADTTARCWVTAFGEPTRTYDKHSHSVICLQVADGVVFTGCGDTNARAYDAKSGALKRTYKGHDSAINCLQYINGKLYTGSNDGSLRVWDAREIADDPAADDEDDDDDDEVDEDTEEGRYYADQARRVKELEWRLGTPEAGEPDPDIAEYEKELAGIVDVD